MKKNNKNSDFLGATTCHLYKTTKMLYSNNMNYINLPKPMSVDNIDVKRLMNKLDNYDIHYDSIKYDGYMTTIVTNAIPMAIFKLISSKFTYMITTKEKICQK